MARRTIQSLRLGVPDLFRAGRFEQVLIATFGPDLEFYERVLRRHFGNFRNQIVLADGRLLDETVAGLAANGVLRHLNRSWLAGPIRTRHAAHAKLILLAGPEQGLLLVGSGNLNLSGYAGGGECLTPYRWNPDEVDDLPAFTAVRALTDGLVAMGHLDAVTVERVGAFWSAYDWWHRAPLADGPVRHNLDTPLGMQFVDALGGERVEELIVATPFHDPRCAALERLLTELNPDHLRVLVQPGHCSVDPGRLSAVVAEHGGEVYAIEAAGDLTGTYLHAKVILAKTASRSVCLTGSANCSIVALWATHPNANIELANLADGSRDAFDHLLDPSMVTITGPVDPAALNVQVLDQGDKNEATPTSQVVDVRWVAPRVLARISPPVFNEQLVTVQVGGEPVAAVVTLEQIDAEWTAIGAELTDPNNVASVDGVAVVSIVIAGVAAGAAVPYQVDRLREQDRRRVDADRLRHAAQLELEDPDLEQALAALEEILVGDNAARWGRDDVQSAATAEDEASIAWEDIEWTAVRRHPRFSAYGNLAGFAEPGSGLAAYLEALSQVVHELLDPDAATAEGPHPTGASVHEEDEGEDDEEGLAGGVDGANVDDQFDGEPEPEPDAPGHQSPAARNRRLIRNFVRRNLRALEHPDFRAGVGPGIVIPNAIILNWVCWWVATKDEQAWQPELVDERIRLWRLLWGSQDGRPGYLDELDDEHQQLVVQSFDHQHVEAVTIASIGDVWASIPEVNDPAYRDLRSVLRRAVTHPCWQVTSAHLESAAILTNGRPTTVDSTGALDLAERLWETGCEPHGDREERTAMAIAIGVAPSAVTMSLQAVSVDGTSARHTVQQAAIAAAFDDTKAAAALAAWRGIRDLPYYRLKWRTGVAFYDEEDGSGWIVPDDGPKVDFVDVDPDYPRWRTALNALYDAVEARHQRAA